ncbi:hypothetical protein MRX96_012176 [Rhipicephalus microplus]
MKDVDIASPPRPLQPKEPEQMLPKPASETAIAEKKEAIPKHLESKESNQRFPKPISGTANDEKRKGLPLPGEVDQRPVQDILDDGGASKLAKPRKAGDMLEDKRPSAVLRPDPYALKELPSKGDLERLEVDSLGPDDEDFKAKKGRQHPDGEDFSVLSVEFPPQGSFGESIAEMAPEEVVKPGEPKEGINKTGAPAVVSGFSIEKKEIVARNGHFSPRGSVNRQAPRRKRKRSFSVSRQDPEVYRIFGQVQIIRLKSRSANSGGKGGRQS